MSKPAETAIAALLQAATQRLHSDSPALDAEVLLAHALGRPRSYLRAWPERIPDAAAQARFADLLARRIRGEPVAYLTGTREFWSLSLDVTPDTLIPRPDTETLVTLALELIPTDADWRIADLGTGSGAIALALARERPGCRVTATDSSPAALAVAQGNALRHGLENIEFVAGDWCSALNGNRFALIVSNPPYIPAGDPHLAQGDVRFEPRGALAAGEAGLDALRDIVRCAAGHLAGPGWLLLEHGYNQGEAISMLLGEAGYRDISDHSDHAGLGRVARARRPAG
jgi:release factor glutamine methyltransferase